jgi:hypothetical protein
LIKIKKSFFGLNKRLTVNCDKCKKQLIDCFADYLDYEESARHLCNNCYEEKIGIKHMNNVVPMPKVSDIVKKID